MKVQYIVKVKFITGETEEWTVDHIHRADDDIIELYHNEQKTILPMRNVLWATRTLSCDCSKTTEKDDIEEVAVNGDGVYY